MVKVGLLLAAVAVASALPLSPLVLEDSPLDHTDVDLVYIWMDATNEAQAAEREAAIQAWDSNLVHHDSRVPKRFSRHPHGLRFALTFALEFAPWINKIHVVMSDMDRPPVWMDNMIRETSTKPGGEPRIVVRHHREIFPDDSHLPTYNSFAIEAWLHRIPDLTEHFIYFNDDMMIAGPVEKAMFFSNTGLPHLWPDLQVGVVKNVRPKEDAYWGTIRRSNNLLEKSAIGTQLNGLKWAYYIPEHQARAMRKSLMEQAHDLFSEALVRTSSNKFRSTTDVWSLHLAFQVGLVTHRAIVSGHNKFGMFLFGMLTENRQSTEYLLMLLTKNQYKLICVNRDIVSEEYDREYEAILQNTLQRHAGFKLTLAAFEDKPIGGKKNREEPQLTSGSTSGKIYGTAPPLIDFSVYTAPTVIPVNNGQKTEHSVIVGNEKLPEADPASGVSSGIAEESSKNAANEDPQSAASSNGRHVITGDELEKISVAASSNLPSTIIPSKPELSTEKSLVPNAQPQSKASKSVVHHQFPTGQSLGSSSKNLASSTSKNHMAKRSPADSANLASKEYSDWAGSMQEKPVSITAVKVNNAVASEGSGGLNSSLNDLEPQSSTVAHVTLPNSGTSDLAAEEFARWLSVNGK